MEIRKAKLYKGKVEIIFEEDKEAAPEIHRFKNSKGERKTGVTSITGVIDKSRPLIFWAVGLTRDFLTELIEKGQRLGIEHVDEACTQWSVKRKKAADIGTEIHDYISKWIKNEKTEMPTDPKVRNGVAAFLEWVRESKLKLQNSETIVYSLKHDFAGIMDADARKGKESYIVDFKSSKRNKYNDTGFYNEQRYQLAGYWLAREEETKRKYDGGYLVRFDKEDGSFQTLLVSRKEYEKDRAAFLGALEIKKREKELK